jgi:TolB-like protein
MRAWRIRLDLHPASDAAAKPSIKTFRTLALPNKPSIAVLPFQNMSGDPEQEYFVDGMVEDIITALSRIRWLFVIARNSTFTYKGEAVDVKQVGRELGVRYVLEGSVRKGGTRVRITAQLIDALTGSHLWADRYDRELTDIFAVQDEITGSVAAVIEPALAEAEQQRVSRKAPESLDAWEAYQRGLWHFYKYAGDENRIAQTSFAVQSRLIQILLPVTTDLHSRNISISGFTQPCHGPRLLARGFRKRELRCRWTTRIRWRTLRCHSCDRCAANGSRRSPKDEPQSALIRIAPGRWLRWAMR